MDLLTLLTPHARDVCSGKFYEKMPMTPTDSGQVFTYEYIDPTSWHYNQLFQNVKVSESASAAIKTKTPLPWKVGSYLRTQDGVFYYILSVQRDYNAAPRQAFRMFAEPAGVEYVLRLAEREEPWGVQ